MDSAFDRETQNWLDGKGPIPKNMVAFLRSQVEKAKPYAPDEKRDYYFDYISDREEATMAMETLKEAGLWTAEDEKNAFG